jgi:hypothetical protein
MEDIQELAEDLSNQESEIDPEDASPANKDDDIDNGASNNDCADKDVGNDTGIGYTLRKVHIFFDLLASSA